MGIDKAFGLAFAKAQLGGGVRLPCQGRVFISVRDEDKARVLPIAQTLHRLGFQIVATRGTAAYFKNGAVPSERVNKIQEGSPHVADAIEKGEIAIVINTPRDAHSHADSFYLRRCALNCQIPYFTTVAGAEAAVEGIELLKDRTLEVQALQDYQTDGGRTLFS